MAYIVELTDIAPARFTELAHQQTQNGATRVDRIVQADGLLTLRATYPGEDEATAKKPPGGTGGGNTGGNGPPAGTSGGGGADNAPPAAAGLSAAFRRHGTFVYDAQATVADYGTIANTVDSMIRAGMQHAWVSIHGTQAHGTANAAFLQGFVDALRTAGISVGGWGWCQGVSAAGDARLALKELDRYGLSDYVADIEHGTSNANWTTDEIGDFCRRIRDELPGSFAISTYALIDWHEPDLMQAALDYVHAFAPQIYWFSFPNKKMVDQFQRPDGSRYRVNDAGEYVELCLDRWTRLMGANQKPLIVTGQAYWGESNSQTQAEQKLDEYFAHWSRYDRIAALNWWHFGGATGMSHAMLESIVNARLGDRTYR